MSAGGEMALALLVGVVVGLAVSGALVWRYERKWGRAPHRAVVARMGRRRSSDGETALLDALPAPNHEESQQSPCDDEDA